MKTKRIRLLALPLTVLLLLGGLVSCKKETKLASRGQIIVFAAEDSILPVEIAHARETAKLFADPRTLVVQRVSGDALTDSAALAELVEKVFDAQSASGTIHGVVFAQGFTGASSAANWFLRHHPEVRVAVCQPVTPHQGFANTAVLVLDFDHAGMARAAAAQAKAMGADTFYFMTTTRTDRTPGAVQFRDTLKAECAALGLRYNDPEVRDLLTYGTDPARAEIIQYVKRAEEESPGGKFAMYTTDRLANEHLAVELLRRKAVVPGLSGGSPLEGIPYALGLDMAGHAADAAYALTQGAALAEQQGFAGSIAVWQASLPSLMLETAVRVVNELESDAAPTQKQVEAAFKASLKAAGAKATIAKDDTQENMYRVLCELKGLG